MIPTYFVTLNWNTTDLLKRMIASVEVATPEPHVWVIVDNGSTEDEYTDMCYWVLNKIPGNLLFLTEGSLCDGERWGREPDLDLVCARSETNLGCILGHNLAFDVIAAIAQEPYQIVMIDTDVVVDDRGWLTRACAWADDHPDVGILGFEHAQRELCAPAIFLDTNGNWYLHEDQTRRPEPVESESVGLGFALLRPQMVRREYRFDTAYRMYYKQDDDLCFDVRWDGLQVWAYPVACVHYGSGSLRVNDYQVGDAAGWDEFDQVKQANQALFTRKWRWALRDRRRDMAGEAAHLREMKAVMAARQWEDD